MDLAKISKIITDDLKLELVKAGHKKSENLHHSIKAKIVNGNIIIEAAEYLKYLDKGKFLKDFLASETKKISPIIAKMIGEDIHNTLKISVK